MATWYVNSAATGTGAGTSWINACTTMAAAITLSAAGDDFNVANTHAETTASALTLTFKGTAASPNRIFSCDTTNAPAQAGDILAGASISTTGAVAITVSGFVYIYGLTFNAGGSIGNASAGINPQAQIYENCLFALVGTGAPVIVLGAATAGRGTEIRWISTKVSFSAATQAIEMQAARFFWTNTASAVQGTAPTSLFSASGSTCSGVVSSKGLDLSAVTGTLVAALAGAIVFVFQDCKLASGVVALSTPSAQSGATVDLINCDSGATGYRQEHHQYQGALTASTAVYNAASDGVTPISWQIVTTANAKRYMPFECFERIQWVAPGTYSNTLMNITSATAGLTNADVWIEAQILDNASFPISDLYSSAPATQLTAGSALPSGSAWVTPLSGTPSNYQLQVPPFTVAIAGYMRFTVKVGKASQTLYVDPVVVVA